MTKNPPRSKARSRLNRLVVGVGILTAFAVSAHDHAATDRTDWRGDLNAYLQATDDVSFHLSSTLDSILESVLESTAPFPISSAEFKSKLEEFSGVREFELAGVPRKIGERKSTEGRTLAREWLKKNYEALGFEVSLHSYSRGANFIAERKGTSGKILILSSHLDSVGNAGANDDGTGTIAALLIAQALKDSPIRHTLRILAFDNEEQGLIGSSYYAQTLDRSQVMGDIQLEMMGYNSKKDGRFHLIDCNRSDSKFLTEAILAKVQSLGTPLTRVQTCTQASDHSSFWDVEIPAVVLSENFFGGDGDPCYHQSCDQVDDRLDFDYAARITAVVGSTVLDLLQ